MQNLVQLENSLAASWWSATLQYNDVMMGAMASQITSLPTVYSTIYSGTDQRKYQSSASLAFERGIHRWPVNSPHKGAVTQNISIWWRHHRLRILEKTIGRVYQAQVRIFVRCLHVPVTHDDVIKWKHFSALPTICAGNSHVTGEFPTQRPVTRSFGAFFDMRLNKRLSKQWWGWWFETPLRPLWRHSDCGINYLAQYLILT